MKLDEILGKLKAEDVPIMEIPEQDKLLNFLRPLKNDVTFEEIKNNTDISIERLLEINQEISLHFKTNLAPKVFFKAMSEAEKDQGEQFQQFFQRIDVDLCCNFLFKILNIKQNLRNLNTPQFIFLKENWEKYRGY